MMMVIETNDRIKQITTKTASLVIPNRSPEVVINILTKGYKNIYVYIPLGENDSSLMTYKEFYESEVTMDFNVNRHKTKVDKTKMPKDKVKSDSFGLFNLQIKGDVQKLNEFDFTIRQFNLVEKEGEVRLYISDKIDFENLEIYCFLEKEKEKINQIPMIKFFVADNYFIHHGQEVTLKWEIDPPSENFQLMQDKIPIPRETRTVNCFKTTPHADTEYTLKLDGHDSICKTINLTICKQNAFFHLVSKFNPSKAVEFEVLGFYHFPYSNKKEYSAFSDRLFAFIRYKDDKDNKAQLWSSENVFMPNSWRYEDFSISTEIARRPGVIFNNKLWLIGGDSCNPDCESDCVGYYDFTKKSYYEEESHKFPEDKDRVKGMGKRMGHAVLLLPDTEKEKERIWVVGGYSQNGGAYDDIWEFDGTKWEEKKVIVDKLRQSNEWFPRCLFGSLATQDAVWIAGGFSSPGGKPNYGDIWRFNRTASLTDDQAKPWAKSITSLLGVNEEFCSCALFLPDLSAPGPYAVVSYNANTDQTSEIKYKIMTYKQASNLQFTNYGEPVGSGVDILKDDEYLHLQTVNYKGAVFLRTLLANRPIQNEYISYYVTLRK